MSLQEAQAFGLAPEPSGLPGVREVLEALDEPALLTDPSHEISAHNTPARSAFGLSERQLGEGLMRVLRPRADGSAAWLGALEGHLSTCEGRTMLPVRLRVHGSVRDGTWGMFPLRGPNESRHLLHRLYLHEEEQPDQAEIDFLANVSHDFRTPLAALAATVEVMMQDYQTLSAPELGMMIRLLHRNTRRLESLVGNLLDAASLRNGKFQLRRSMVSPHSLLRDASDHVQSLLSNKNQKLDMRLIGHVPALLVDSKRIVAVLVNLLSNANRYGDPDEPIQLLVSGEGTQVRFTIRQRGPGIPEQEQARLFHRFYRASTSEGVHGGSGLGLAIVKEIVEMHGGTVGVMSKTGSTAFWFTLPLEGVQP